MGEITSLFAHKMVAAAGGEIDARAHPAAIGLDADARWDPKAMIPAEAYYGMIDQMAERMDVTALSVQVGAWMRCDEYPTSRRGLGRASAPFTESWPSMASACRP